VANILIIDDDQTFCMVLSTMVKHMQHEASVAYTLQDGLGALSSNDFDVVFLDVRLPDGSGLDILPTIRETLSPPEVIIVTGLGDPDGAELAIKSGAWDYLEKPSSIKQMTLPLVRALQYREEKNRRPLLVLNREGIIGNSPRMKSCLELLAQACGGDANVLVTGETGTGKELFALALHQNSPRADHSFVVVDCTALPETLVESMLFGHVRGAFTGADKAQEGLIKQADGGTLFLDEVGELPLNVQKTFLRVLQEHRFRPIGSKQEVESRFRLVAATNRELDQMVEEGQFRKDLLFRLRSITIELPPLRERLEDMKELVLFHMRELCERYGVGMKGFAPEFFDVLAAYDWPGNVRELVNVLERTLNVARYEPTLFPNYLPTDFRIRMARASICSREVPETSPEEEPRQTHEIYEAASGSSSILPPLSVARDCAIASTEKQYLHDLMLSTQGNIKEACRISGLSRARLYALLKRYDVARFK
jgi:two-component system NtrC family response regulator